MLSCSAMMQNGLDGWNRRKGSMDMEMEMKKSNKSARREVGDG
jgi:hypothetical protein